MRRKLLPRALHLPPAFLLLLLPPLETSHTNRLHLTLLYPGAARGQGEGGASRTAGLKAERRSPDGFKLSDVSFRSGHAALLANAGPLTHTHGRHCTENVPFAVFYY